jgi:uncharacterized membrane protein
VESLAVTKFATSQSRETLGDTLGKLIKYTSYKSMNRNLIFGIILLLVTIMFVGVYRDDEYFEPDLFIKYQPTTKMFFYSPTGQSDAQLKDLTSEQKKEEIAFKKYIIERKIQSNNKLNWLAYLLVLTTFCFVLCGIIKIVKRSLIK